MAIRNIYEDEKMFDRFKVEDLITPQNNRTVKMNMYWICIDGYVFRHKLTKAWQCNSNEVVIQHLAKSYAVPYKLFPVLYV